MDMTYTPIRRLLLKLSPPVMLALLIQSVYNIVDSFFVARYSNEGLTALSIVYPMQLLMTALATGIGAGVNLLISRMDGQGETEKQSGVVTCGLVMALPMAAQIVGAVINIILDPILIFGLFGSPCMGIAGAAVATVL